MPTGQFVIIVGGGLLTAGSGTLHVGSPGAGSMRRTGGIGGACRTGGITVRGGGGGVDPAGDWACGGTVSAVIENVAGYNPAGGGNGCGGGGGAAAGSAGFTGSDSMRCNNSSSSSNCLRVGLPVAVDMGSSMSEVGRPFQADDAAPKSGWKA
jgi:hypothetical protein